MEASLHARTGGLDRLHGDTGGTPPTAVIFAPANWRDGSPPSPHRGLDPARPIDRVRVVRPVILERVRQAHLPHRPGEFADEGRRVGPAAVRARHCAGLVHEAAGVPPPVIRRHRGVSLRPQRDARDPLNPIATQNFVFRRSAVDRAPGGVARPPFLYPGMALVVFLRGVNVGGHRTFRPSILARQLRDYDVVNVGAAGTFVVRKPGSRATFRAALLRKLPFAAVVVLCDGRELIRLEPEHPFGTEPSRPDVVRFVSILSNARRGQASIPITLPPSGRWLVRVIGSKNRFVFGVYRRHMKTIGYLGQIDRLFGVPATTRNWNTIVAIVRILKGHGKKGR